MKVAIYSRVSTSTQDTQNQLVQLRAFAATQGWTVVCEFVDIASGKMATASSFEALG
jgi:putative DNA-invertase from lambdoid prophage Rac